MALPQRTKEGFDLSGELVRLHPPAVINSGELNQLGARNRVGEVLTSPDCSVPIVDPRQDPRRLRDAWRRGGKVDPDIHRPQCGNRPRAGTDPPPSPPPPLYLGVLVDAGCQA